MWYVNELEQLNQLVVEVLQQKEFHARFLCLELICLWAEPKRLQSKCDNRCMLKSLTSEKKNKKTINFLIWPNDLFLKHLYTLQA